MTWKTTREYTNKLVTAIDEGIIDPKVVLTACLAYMSEDDVKDMCEINDFTQAWEFENGE